jgi:hypothetical protein
MCNHFQAKTVYPKKELDEHKKLKNVIMTHTQSSCNNEDLWIKTVVDKKLFELLGDRNVRDSTDVSTFLLSDDDCATSRPLF